MCPRTERACGSSLSAIHGLVVPEPPELCHLRTTFPEVLFRRTEVELETVTNEIQAKPMKTMQTAHFGNLLAYKGARGYPVSVRTAADRPDWPFLVSFWTDIGDILQYSGNYYYLQSRRL